MASPCIPLFAELCAWTLFCYAVFSVLSSFAIISMGKREPVAIFNLVTVSVQWLFLTVPWVGLQCVIVVFPKQLITNVKKHLHIICVIL